MSTSTNSSMSCYGESSDPSSNSEWFQGFNHTSSVNCITKDVETDTDNDSNQFELAIDLNSGLQITTNIKDDFQN